MTTNSKPTHSEVANDRSSSLKSTHEQPGGFLDTNADPEVGLVNDSLGSVDIADSTGLDEDKETGDAKRLNKNTRED